MRIIQPKSLLPILLQICTTSSRQLPDKVYAQAFALTVSCCAALLHVQDMVSQKFILLSHYDGTTCCCKAENAVAPELTDDSWCHSTACQAAPQMHSGWTRPARAEHTCEYVLTHLAAFLLFETIRQVRLYLNSCQRHVMHAYDITCKVNSTVWLEEV